MTIIVQQKIFVQKTGNIQNQKGCVEIGILVHFYWNLIAIIFLNIKNYICGNFKYAYQLAKQFHFWEPVCGSQCHCLPNISGSHSRCVVGLFSTFLDLGIAIDWFWPMKFEWKWHSHKQNRNDQWLSKKRPLPPIKNKKQKTKLINS